MRVESWSRLPYLIVNLKSTIACPEVASGPVSRLVRVCSQLIGAASSSLCQLGQPCITRSADVCRWPGLACAHCLLCAAHAVSNNDGRSWGLNHGETLGQDSVFIVLCPDSVKLCPPSLMTPPLSLDKSGTMPFRSRLSKEERHLAGYEQVNLKCSGHATSQRGSLLALSVCNLFAKHI